jgi:hypothetical protein
VAYRFISNDPLNRKNPFWNIQKSVTTTSQTVKQYVHISHFNHMVMEHGLGLFFIALFRSLFLINVRPFSFFIPLFCCWRFCVVQFWSFFISPLACGASFMLCCNKSSHYFVCLHVQIVFSVLRNT